MRLEKIIKDVFFRLFCFVLFVFLRRLDRIIRLSDRRWKSPAKSVEWIGASAPEGIFFFPFLLSSSSLLSAFASAFDCRIDRIGESVFTIIFLNFILQGTPKLDCRSCGVARSLNATVGFSIQRD